jgi:hypothetical protein
MVINNAPKVVNGALENFYSTGITHDDRNRFIVQASNIIL